MSQEPTIPASSEATTARRPSVSIGALFFCSGAVSLGFEVVWASQLTRLLGGNTSAIAYIVSLFMGGLGLGYWVAGKVSSRIDRPMAVYGAVELLLAALALGTVLIFPNLENRLSLAGAYLVCGALILPCTFLMGATLPLLVQGTGGAVGQALGKLYSLNTAGAVTGALATGLFIIGALGLSRTAMTLAALGVMVGLTALYLGRNRRLPRPDAPSPLHGKKRWLIFSALFGLASLGEEVLWTRALAVHLNSSTYAFSAILAVFLAGLAMGAATASWAIKRGVSVGALFVLTQVLAGATVLMSPELLLIVEDLLPGYVGVAQIATWEAWWSSVGLGLARTVLALVVPTFCLGFALPLCAQLYCGESTEHGQAAGRVAGANAVGAVLGSLAARFVLLPNLGVAGGLQVLAMVHAFVAIGVVLTVARPLLAEVHKRSWVAICVVLLVACIIRPKADPFLGRMLGSAAHKVIFIDEGVQDTTAIVEMPTGRRHIFSNGIAYAGDHPTARRYMRLLGHLPSLVARKQERALVICLGTGMTAAAVARHPFAEIHLVDISPVVFSTLPYFDAVNDQVYKDPRVRFHITDGRVFMAQSNRSQFDVITLEPPPPRASGVAALYSEDFYRRAKELLTEGGSVAQWLPLHGMTVSELKMLTRTFLEVFPEGQLIKLHPDEAALLATVGRGAPGPIVNERANTPGVVNHMRSIQVENPRTLPSVAGQLLLDRIGPGPIVTDDHPRIEHFAAGLGADEIPTEEAGAVFLRQVLAP